MGRGVGFRPATSYIENDNKLLYSPIGDTITYTTIDNSTITLFNNAAFKDNANNSIEIASNTYNNNIGKIKFEKEISTIEDMAFYNCTGLTSICLLDSITRINNQYAFSQCKNLTNVQLPNYCKYIGAGTFEGCSKLSSIELPSTILSFGLSVFNGCISLQSLIIPQNIKEIPAFFAQSCLKLTNIKISNNVTIIGQRAFKQCYSLESLDLPEMLKTIDSSSFNNCSNLHTINIMAVNPPSITNAINEQFMDGTSLEHIYVPSESVDVYKTANGWKDFADKIEAFQ